MGIARRRYRLFRATTLRRARRTRCTKNSPGFLNPGGQASLRVRSQTSFVHFAARQNPRCKWAGLPLGICIHATHAECGLTAGRKAGRAPGRGRLGLSGSPTRNEAASRSSRGCCPTGCIGSGRCGCILTWGRGLRSAGGVPRGKNEGWE